MRTSVRLATGDGFTADAVTCLDDHRDWSAQQAGDHHLIVLVRRGRFRRRSRGHTADLDPTLAYLGLPGEEEHFAHPSGGDLCTSLALTGPLWHRLTGGRPLRPTLYVDGRLDLAHRRLLRATRSGDAGFAVAESLLDLLRAALAQSPPPAASTAPLAPCPASGRPPGHHRHPGAVGGKASGPARTGPGGARRKVKGDSGPGLVSSAREAIAAGHPAAGGLLTLAALLEVSPFQLSRAFTREMGVSLTHYRNRVRVAGALDRLEQGESDLAGLAVELGFADQAHLTRTTRQHVGHTPAALRRLLGAER
ncbi:AraC family transcriptional regulator [Nonomuraea sp. NPDC050310]|uniref:helix-turn-helix domain-containing protein n=1 Tax=Nonomuraea sp. NPDC050310 TaxID=3154935 RepID=UPI0033DC8F98